MAKAIPMTSNSTLANSSFETGDLLGWQTTGSISVETSGWGATPTDGNYQALLSNGGTGTPASDSILESFLGLSAGALDALGNGNATEGSAITQTLTVEAGDVLSFDWNFFTSEGANSFYNDFAFVAIGGTLLSLADTSSPLIASPSTSFGNETSYSTFTYEFTSAGTYSISLGVVNVADTWVDSALAVDNFRFGDATEPPAIDPGDTIPEATATGLSFGNPGTFSFSGTIGDNPLVAPGSDVDFFSLEAVAGDLLVLDIDADELGTGLDSVLQLFDEWGYAIVTSDNDPAPDESFGSDSYLSFVAPYSGTYYVGVSGYDNFGYDPYLPGSSTGFSTGAYELSATVLIGEEETGDTIPEATATGLSFGNPGTFSFSGTIGDNPLVAPGSDVDFFSLEAIAGDLLVFDIDADELGTGLDSVLQLFDEWGYAIATSDNDPAPDESFGSDSYLSFVAPYSGTYYVGVSGYDNFGYDPYLPGSSTGFSTGAYELSATVVASSEEPGDSIPEAMATGLSFGNPGTFSFSGEIGDNLLVAPGSDVDFFSLEAVAGDLLVLDIDADELGTGLDSVLQLFDEWGYAIATSDNDPAPDESFGSDSYLSFVAPYSGTYYVGVSGYDNFGYDPYLPGSSTGFSTGAYELSVTIPTGGEEPGDMLPTATATGLSFTNPGTFSFSGTIGDNPLVAPGSDVDFFSLEAETGDWLVFDIDADELGTGLDSVLQLFDEWGYAIATSDNDPAPDELYSSDSYLTFSVPYSGTYYVGVSGYDNFGYDPYLPGSSTGFSTGAYELSASVVASNEEPGDSIPEAKITGLSLGNPGTFSFSGEIGDNLLVPPEGDVDFFSLEAETGDWLVFDIDADELGTGLDSVLQLFDEWGNPIATSDNDPAPGESYGSDPYLASFAFYTGTYYIGVSSYGNSNYDPYYDPNYSYDPYYDPYDPYNPSYDPYYGYDPSVSGSSSGAYELSATVLTTDTEPGNIIDMALATGLSIGNSGTFSFSGEIGDSPLVPPGSDIDLFSLEAAAGNLLAFDIDADELGTGLNSALQLFDQGGYLLATSDDDPAPGESFGFDSYLSFNAPYTGTYYVGVSSYDNYYDPNYGYDPGYGYDPYDPDYVYNPYYSGSSTGAYELSATVLTGDEEPGDMIDMAMATGLSLGNPGTFSFSGEIGDNPLVPPGSDIDLFSLEAAAGDAILIDIDADELGTGLDSALQLFDEWGYLLAGSDNDAAPGELSGSDSYLAFFAPYTGTYYVGASSYDNYYDPNYGYDPGYDGYGFAPNPYYSGSSTGAYDLEISIA